MRLLAFLVSLTVLANISFWGNWVASFYYIVLISALLIIFFPSKGLNFNFNLFLIVLAAFLSILVNEIPSFFKPEERFVSFILILSLVSPLITSPKFNLFRENLFRYLNILIMFLVSLSFFGLIVGFAFVNNFSGFSGFFNNSMMLGPMAAISFLNALYYYYASNNKKWKRIFILVIIFSFLALVSAGSRIAISALLAATLFFFYKKNQGNLSSFTSSIVFIVFLLVISFPLWKKNTGAIIQKMEYSESQGDLYASRTDLWVSRIQEFQSSPIFGIGFASVDKSKNESFDLKSGSIEPGSSWLVILSMVGLFGFIPFFIMVSKYIFKILKTKNNILFWAYLGSLIVLFLVHMGGEGYVFSAGSGLFFYLWLLFGIIDRFIKDMQSKYF